MTRRRFGSIVTLGNGGHANIEARYTPTHAMRDQWAHLPKRFARRFPPGWDIQAEQWLNDEEHLIRLGTWTPPSQRRHKALAQTLTFHEYAAKWIERRRKPDGKPIRETTRQKYRENLANHLDPTFADMPLASITYHDILVWHDRYPIGVDGTGQAQRTQSYILLKAILKTAATEPLDDSGTTLIDRSPAILDVPKPPKRHVSLIAELDELRTLAAAMPAHLGLAVMLGGILGLREGEVCGLQRRDIELETTPPMLHVRHAVKPIYDAHGHRNLILDEPKSAGSRRDIIIPDSLVSMIREQLRSYAGSGDNGMMFPGRDGRLLSPQSLRNAWERTRNIVPRLHGMRFHDLRHTALTRLAELGATGGELMAQAGHTSLRIASVYQQASDSHRTEVMRRLDQAMKGKPERSARSSDVDLVGELRKLAELHDDGVLDADEFKAAKRKLLEG